MSGFMPFSIPGMPLTEEQKEIVRLKGLVKEYEDKINTHNEKMARVPSLPRRPESPQEAMRVLADWFDALDRQTGEKDHTVQIDLRTFAIQVERLREELSDMRATCLSLIQAMKFYAHPHQYGLGGGSSNNILTDAGKVAKDALKAVKVGPA